MSDAKMDEASDRRREFDEVLIDALASGQAYAEAGELVGLSERTVARRMSEEPFARLVSTRRATWIAQVTGSLTRLAVVALKAIEECIASADEPIRLRAADIVLKRLLEFRHHGELEQRLRALEDLIDRDETDDDSSAL
jgi:hypothetical protein